MEQFLVRTGFNSNHQRLKFIISFGNDLLSDKPKISLQLTGKMECLFRYKGRISEPLPVIPNQMILLSFQKGFILTNITAGNHSAQHVHSRQTFAMNKGLTGVCVLQWFILLDSAFYKELDSFLNPNSSFTCTIAEKSFLILGKLLV